VATATESGSIGARLGGALVALAAAVVILGVSALPFMTPAWIHFEQDRTGAAALTGYAADDLRRATDGIVHDLFLGGDFGVVVAGSPVLDPAEQGHMRDVQGAFAGAGVAVLASVIVLIVAAGRSRASAARALLWDALRRGAASLAVLLAVLGVIAVVAFDAAFEVFHQLLFPGGNFTFDPRTEKLVQLFPVQLFSETALAYGAVALILALAAAWSAGRRSAASARSRVTGTMAGASGASPAMPGSTAS